FFQAEDGIRDFHVTGVQTCALPILLPVPQSKSCSIERVMIKSPMLLNRWNLMVNSRQLHRRIQKKVLPLNWRKNMAKNQGLTCRSEERRLGKESRTGA